jgi:hypothetical protein
MLRAWFFFAEDGFAFGLAFVVTAVGSPWGSEPPPFAGEKKQTALIPIAITPTITQSIFFFLILSLPSCGKYAPQAGG